MTIGWQIPVVRSAIIPIILGDEVKTVALASELTALGMCIPAIRYPTVARGQARLRLTVSAAHSSTDIAALLDAFERCEKPGPT